MNEKRRPQDRDKGPRRDNAPRRADRFAERTVEDNIISEQIEADVRRLVEHLPDEQREVVKLRYFSGLSFQEIADQTGVSINTALGRMRYALINLRKMIAENNIILS